ncbi:DUF72 domain-containing protein [Rhizorhapis sp. SPR117]|uniref:DUF72 domain-containing protein n=1 Tax=Rhizorhapis sp. SPR117 TaxID=2912611 RepID=UPI001F3ED504|nr:DUF72 domain-containing protein [Rhizorhapis sp. SPR117]
MANTGKIYAGIGGWTFEPWRGTFYPPGLPHARELEYAATHLSAIEINGTYYRLQKPESFAAWAKTAPDGFVFAVKASRVCTNRRVLAEAGEAVAKFLGQGIAELGEKLGPILWQFMPTKAYNPDDFDAFLNLLPEKLNGLSLRHAVEVRHESFLTPAFIDSARKAGVAVVFADTTKYPQIADVTGDFVYARLQDAREDEPMGYGAEALDRWTSMAHQWAQGKSPKGLEYVTDEPAKDRARDVFVFMINGAKIRAPAAAQALLERLGRP